MSKSQTSSPLGIKPQSTPSANRSASRSTCFGRASLKPFRLSTITGGHAFLSIMGVSRVGLEDCFEESRLGGLNVFFSFSVSGVLLPSCDALYLGRTSSECSILRRLGLSLRCELGAGVVVGRDMARFRFGGAGKGSRATSSGGGDGRKQEFCVERSHELI